MIRFFLIFIAIFFISCGDEKITLNKKAPQIYAKDTSGKSIKLEGKGLELVEFWENGCAACLKVMASLNDYALEHNIKIYAINSIDELKVIKKHENENDYASMRFLADQQDISWSRYDVFAVPTLFILKDGVYVDRVLGDRGFAHIKQKLEKYL